jgi:hypothetical protein
MDRRAEMSNREKIRYLKQYKNLDRRINRLLEDKERWRTIAEKTTQSITGMPHGGDGEDKRELAICNMVDCEIEANDLIDQLEYLREEIRHYISTTGDNDENLLVVLQVEK